MAWCLVEAQEQLYLYVIYSCTEVVSTYIYFNCRVRN
jgi:hypothetical protein